MKWCPNCKINVNPIRIAHVTLQLPVLSCPRCESSYLKPAKELK